MYTNFCMYDLLTLDKLLKVYYQHDLESFFYTLLWIQLHYVGGKEINHPRAKSFKFHFDGSWCATQGQKEGFLLGACFPSGYQLPLPPCEVNG